MQSSRWNIWNQLLLHSLHHKCAFISWSTFTGLILRNKPFFKKAKQHKKKLLCNFWAGKLSKAKRLLALNVQLWVRHSNCRHRVNSNPDCICKCGLRRTEERHNSVAGPPQIKLITAGPERITATPLGLQMGKCDGMCIFNTPSVIPSKPKHLAVLRPTPGTVLCPGLLFKMCWFV